MTFSLPRWAALVLALALGACSGELRHHPLPEALASAGEIPGYNDVRFYGDAAPPDLERRIEARVAQLKARLAEQRAAGGRPAINMLAISGGAQDGAFGAGFLVGWSRAGTRPEFDLVTGISTGGLAAPFVFLGEKYDPVLREVYTTVTRADIYRACALCGLFGGPAFAKTEPLRRLIQRHVTPQVFAEIAAAHREGRRLWIGTTNLETGRPVIWDIGALATSGREGALALFHKILLATSAIPTFFPPVAIPVEAGGERYTELHVDGGATFTAFLYPPEIYARPALERLEMEVPVNLYVILNVKNPPYYERTEPESYQILERALYVTVQYKAVADAARIYEVARRDGLDFHMIMIPRTFAGKPRQDFDTEYMRALFAQGLELAAQPGPWLDAPPGADVPAEGAD